MATPEKEKTRVKNLKKGLEKLSKDLKKNKKDDLFKTIRKDDFCRTISGLQELLKQGISESELLGGDKGKSLVLNIRKCGIFEKLPKEFRQSILALNIEEQKFADKKQEDGQKPQTPSPTPSSQSPSTSKQRHGKGAESENHQEKIPTPSSQSPSTSKQRHGKEAETKNHQEKIQTLEKEFAKERNKSEKMLHKFNDREKQIKELEQEKDEKIKFLKDESKDLAQRQTLEKELAKERNESEKMLHKFNDREKQIKELEQEKDERIKFLKDESKDLAQRLEKENNIRTTVENDLKSARGMAIRLEQKLNDNFVEREKDKNRIAELEAAYKNLDKQKYHMEQQMQAILKDEKRKADDQYKKLLAERDDLRDRFGKLACQKLQEQNADIVDLSDPNRAMKLSEKFGQIYDDEWTNAFESLTDKKLGVSLKDAINVLLRLLQECWTFCNNLIATQMGSLQNVFLHPAQNMANFDQKKTGLTDRPRITSKDHQSLQDLRKRVGVSPSVIEEVKQALLADSKTWDKREKKKYDKKHIKACTPYIQKCAEICWLMALHDPPLFMKMDVKQCEKIDTNIYTAYRQSGQTIDFLVWPPLYNGSDGGLLSKGVAEPLRV